MKRGVGRGGWEAGCECIGHVHKEKDRERGCVDLYVWTERTPSYTVKNE